MLIVYAILAACFLGGAAFVWHGIGASAVAKHDAEQKVEQDKIEAVAKAKSEVAADWVINAQAQHEVDEDKAKAKAGVRQAAAQTYIPTAPVFQNKECVVQPEGMAILNGARGDLQNTTVAEIFGFTPPAPAPVTISAPPKIVVVPVPTPQPAPAGARPKPAPIK